jgi:hypothetical protein
MKATGCRALRGRGPESFCPKSRKRGRIRVRYLLSTISAAYSAPNEDGASRSETAAAPAGLSGMNEQSKSDDQRDKNLAAEERPVPSQAEGDLDTVEEDLREKNQGQSKTASSGNKG